MQKFQLFKFKTFDDERGSLTALELPEFFGWPVKRFYYVTNTKMARGGHAVRGEKKLYVMMQGSVKARIHDGEKWHECKLEGPSEGLLMNELCFREFVDFSDGAVLAVLSNMPYDPDAYIYDLDKFIEEVGSS